MPAPPEKESWKAPFGGTFTAGLRRPERLLLSRHLQTQRQVAVQAALGYETPTASEKLRFGVRLCRRLGLSNVYFPGTGTNAFAEADIARWRPCSRLMDEKLTFDLGYIRYNYLRAPTTPCNSTTSTRSGSSSATTSAPSQISGAVRYSPNFFAATPATPGTSGRSVVVPLPFIHDQRRRARSRLFGTIGNQSVERFANYGLPNDNYWDWQLGLVVSVYGFDLSAVYTGTNLSVQDCLGTQNCASRVILGIAKAF